MCYFERNIQGDPMPAMGRYVTTSTLGEKVRAFLPSPLPVQPPIPLDADMLDLLLEAQGDLRSLNSISALLPDTGHFLYMYQAREALLSSQIEGTRSSFSELLLFEMDELFGSVTADAQEASNYIRALNYGIAALREGMPLSLRLIRGVHSVLLGSGRGSDKHPGEFRRSQNWIGGSRPGKAHYVPPPPEYLMECLDNLEKYLHDQFGRTALLIKAAVSHAQFEMIHPFLDGNGRVGRLLITLLLCAEGVLDEPLLYLSLYFKKNREQYYQLLGRVQKEGAWREWLLFFLKGVSQTSRQALEMVRRLRTKFENDRKVIRHKQHRSMASMLAVHEAMQKIPVATVRKLSEMSGLAPPTVVRSLQQLEQLGIAREITGGGWRRIYSYSHYLEILSEGTELPES